ncbi:hypothetical protein DAEQUDRAFT_729322 [Daedalea quercina L-15889]|uniref:Uncharacterized protein n=1 Tax=Daedalea quercina L-15889 TaxID=1314783 RepID=A0A165NRK7_9APHY|nr:hypothetical protein DAEQUDRAFT_729322 [Daedalea quercina L-15889]
MGSMHEGAPRPSPLSKRDPPACVHHLGVHRPRRRGPHGLGQRLPREAEHLRREFEVDCKGKKSLFFKRWPQGFRWTCCDLDGETNYGCDHRGGGSKPCTWRLVPVSGPRR